MPARAESPKVPRDGTPGSREDQFAVQAPAVTLPKGGGAIRGIGEKFAANPVTGTGSMTVPIATSPGRSGFGPQLALSYDSGAANGPFGFGWNLSLPSLTRKTDTGLPRYLDGQGQTPDSDVFILSGAEDLVPVYRKDPPASWLAANPGFNTDPDGWVRDPSQRYVVHEDPRTVGNQAYRVRRYRPRVEGLFARIERWTNTADATDVCWRSTSKDNITTWYGRTANSRVADPVDRSRIFTWLICETHDDKGNVVAYGYKPEDSVRVLEDAAGSRLAKGHERNRSDTSRSAQRYLKRIRYGNRLPYFPVLKANEPWPEPKDAPWPKPPAAQPPEGSNSWLFEVVFDYDEHNALAPKPLDAGAWPVRSDPFSSYRAAFEVRTYRVCQRVLMFHHFPDEAGVERDCLVRSTDFTYSDELDPADARNPVYTFLKSVTQAGYRRNNGGYDHRRLPPVEFEYTQPTVQETVEAVNPASLDNLPIGLDGNTYRWTDLHGEGIPGILSEQAGAWFYKRNLSPINERPGHDPAGPDDPAHVARRPHLEAAFAPLEIVALKPNASLGGGADFMDLAGDGQPDVVVMDGPTPGLYEHDDAEGWQPFRSFTSRLNRDFRDPNLKFIDLDGDGHADVLITEDDAFVWHPSLAEEGFGPASRVAQALDEEQGPRIVFADGTQSVHLADLSGDGLTDLVRIRNGEVCYWPNLGYGRFGAKVTMDNAPWFDQPDQFDHKRLRLADIDGSGTTDLIYLHRDGVRLYFNQSGNGWSRPHALKVFPRIDDLASIVPTDLLGNGTACLVWSSSLPADAPRPMRYVNLMGGQKPHLLVKTINNLGAETRVAYAPSTKFYLHDKAAGKAWITRLPFPVHVVERVETWDHISRNRFVTRYAYHHGYFDGEEREFRGFGMVEQWDTEEFGSLTPGGASSADAPSNEDRASHVPPVLTKTWFHTGMYLGGDRVSNYFAGLVGRPDRGEYYREPAWLGDVEEAKKRLLPDTVVPHGLPPEEEREAARSLKGLMLRQEVYALDGAGVAADYPHGHPYTVAEQNFTVRLLQPQRDHRHAVVFTHPREAITYHYERQPKGPRIQHALTLEVDDYGNVLKQAAVGYGRLTPAADPVLTPADHRKQRLIHITSTENSFTNAITDRDDDYRTPLPAEARTYELRQPQQEQSGASLSSFGFDAMRGHVNQAGDGAHDVAYEDFDFSRAGQVAAASNAENARYFRRLIEHVRTLYRPDDCGVAANDPLALLPLQTLQPLALPGEAYRLAFTPGLLDQVFKRPRQGQADEPLLPPSVRAAILGGQAGDQGGYVDLDGNGHWWIPSGRSCFSPNPADPAAAERAQARGHYFLPRRYRDPFRQDAFVDFDTHDLLLKETRDALGNRVTVNINDHRVLQPRLVSDPNRNQTEVTFDALGLVVGTAIMSKPTDNPRQGDRLDGEFEPDPLQGALEAFITKPREATAAPTISVATQAAHDLLANATTRIVYDLDRYMRLGEPPFAATIARETHASDLEPGQQSKLQISFSYSDGFGREIQKKIQAEPGPVPQRDASGKVIVGADGQPVMTANRVSPRWVGSGWTVFNNKGKPVRQYEPFFTDTHRFEFDVRIGVSPVLFYDPAERVIATLHPNQTYEKVVFDPWQQTTWDVNDTCASRNQQTGDPRTDPDIGAYVAEYFRALSADLPPPWHGWHARRIGGALGADEQKAAERAAAHADTPTTAQFDALGRPFLTVARNRVVCENHPLDGKPDEAFATRVELDIEGNQREVRDAITKTRDAAGTEVNDPLGRIVMRYAYDMLGNRIYQLSMEAGARWMLNDVAGKPIRAWDSRGHHFTTTYDALRRPVEQRVRGTTADSDPRTRQADALMVDKIEYGEPPPNATQAVKERAQRLNLRTRIYRRFDSAGVATNARLDASGDALEAYDFKGNLLRTTRRLVTDYKAIPDWSRNPPPLLDAEAFERGTRYDALNRPIQSIAPRSSLVRAKRNVIQPVFNEANLLERVDVWLERATEPVALLNPAAEAPSPVGVANIDYDAKGQRLRIDYKNGASTLYSYDPLTFRLTRLLTRRNADDFPGDDPQAPVAGWPGRHLQNLHYTYDPAGNITHIQDDAQQRIYFNGKRVEPSNDYVYDALYRLIEATGREHLGQVGGAPIPHAPNDAGRVGILSASPPGRFAPNDGNAMGTYTERYVYDAVGNFLRMQHHGDDPAHPGWTRAYDYLEPSLIENGAAGPALKTSNRLTRTTLNPNGANPIPEPYQHDAHGNMVRMPHLGGAAGPNMHWDFKDQLRQTDLGGGGTAYYVYDAAGQRVRKVVVKNNGNLIEDRIYLGGFEIFRRHGNRIATNSATLERETLHIMDDQQRIALVETKTLDAELLPPITDHGSRITNPVPLIRYQFGNHLGSGSVELDEQAQIISYEEYAPYGSSTYQAVRSRTETAKRYRYTGKERDEESGLYYHGARYYTAWLGTWVSCDRTGLIDGNDLYTYVASRPTELVDPSGNAGEKWEPNSNSRRWYRTEGNRRMLGEDRWKTPKRDIGQHETDLRRPGRPKFHPQDGNYKHVPRGRQRTPSTLRNPKGVEWGHPYNKPFHSHKNQGGAPRAETIQDNANKNQIDQHGRSAEGVLPLPRRILDRPAEPNVNVPPDMRNRPHVNVPPDMKSQPHVNTPPNVKSDPHVNVPPDIKQAPYVNVPPQNDSKPLVKGTGDPKNKSGLTPEQLKKLQEMDKPIENDLAKVDEAVDKFGEKAVNVLIVIVGIGFVAAGLRGGMRFAPGGFMVAPGVDDGA